MNYFSSVKGKNVQINRGGPEYKQGRLLEAGSDYIVLQVLNEGIIYFTTEHMKSCTEILGENQSEEVLLQTFGEAPSYSAEEDLCSTLNSLNGQLVQINRGGPDKVEGLLDGCDQEYVTLYNKNELIRFHTWHIKSFNVVIKSDNNQNKNDNQSDGNQSGNQNENKNQSNAKNDAKNEAKNDAKNEAENDNQQQNNDIVIKKFKNNKTLRRGKRTVRQATVTNLSTRRKSSSSQPIRNVSKPSNNVFNPSRVWKPNSNSMPYVWKAKNM